MPVLASMEALESIKATVAALLALRTVDLVRSQSLKWAFFPLAQTPIPTSTPLSDTAQLVPLAFSVLAVLLVAGELGTMVVFGEVVRRSFRSCAAQSSATSVAKPASSSSVSAQRYNDVSSTCWYSLRPVWSVLAAEGGGRGHPTFF